MTTVKKEKVCSKCRKPMLLEQNFYKTPLTEKYEDGYLDECKKCFTMHINIREPGSFLHLLEAVDVPYIESEWDTLVEKYGNNPKTTSTAIFEARAPPRCPPMPSQTITNLPDRICAEA